MAENEAIDDTVGDGALTANIVTASLLRVATKFDASLGRPERVPEEMEADELLAYAAAINVVMDYVEPRKGETFDLTMLAAMANRAFQDAAGNPIRPWDSIDPKFREKWRFFVKHLWNLLDYDADDDGDLFRHEEQITAMFAATLQERGLIPRK